MTEKPIQLERLGWIAAVAVLSTSLVWLAVLNVALLAKTHASQWPALVIAGRAVLKAAVRVAEQGLPLALVGAFVAVVTVMSLVAPRPAGGAGSER